MSLNSLQGYFNFLLKSTKLRQTLILRLICHEVLECSPPCHVWNARACGTPNKIDYDFWENFPPKKKVKKKGWVEKNKSKNIYVQFILYSQCSSWRQILKLLSYFGCIFTFCYLDGANSIKTDLHICNLWTGQILLNRLMYLVKYLIRVVDRSKIPKKHLTSYVNAPLVINVSSYILKKH